MADSKASGLTDAGTLDGAEIIYLVKGGADRRSTPAALPVSIAQQAALNAKASTASVSALTSRVAALETVVGVDLLPVALSALVVGTPTANSVTITFATNRVAQAEVVYGTGTAVDLIPPYNYPATRAEPTGGDGLAHAVTLTGLLPLTTYSFRAHATVAGSEDYSAETTFTTTSTIDSTPPVISALTYNKAATYIEAVWATDDVSDSLLEVRTTAGPGAWLPSQSFITELAHVRRVTSLAPSTQYDCRVTSRNLVSLATTSSISTVTTDPAPGTGTFAYDFAAVDASKMIPLVASPAAGQPTTAITGGEGRVTLGADAGANGFVSTNAFDFRNTETIFHVTGTYYGSGGGAGPNTRAFVGKAGDDTQSIGFIQDNVNIAAVWYRDGVESFGTFRAFDPLTELYWRIREDEASGVVILDTASDLAFTTPIAVETISKATAINTASWSLASAKAQFLAATYAPGSFGAYGPAKVSDLTIATIGALPPPPVETSTFPTASIAGWTLGMGDDFLTAVPEGAWPGTVYGGRWGAYDDGWPDTSHNGTYYSSKVNSVIVANGEHFLRYRVRTENGLHLVAAPQPNHGGPVSKLRVSFRWRCDPLHGYKVAFLLWPGSGVWPRDGEGDFLEGDLDGTVEWYMHRQGATTGGDQDFGESGVRFATGWHITTMEWIGGTSWKVFLDGVQVGSTITSRVPNTPMRVSMQLETTLGGFVPSDAVNGNFDIDWWRCWT